jgi:hypothetical protein
MNIILAHVPGISLDIAWPLLPFFVLLDPSICIPPCKRIYCTWATYALFAFFLSHFNHTLLHVDDSESTVAKGRLDP